MAFINCGKCAFLLVAFSLLLSPTRSSQESTASERASQQEGSTYSDDADGLRQFLLNMLGVAKAGDAKELDALIQDAEIPHPELWFTTALGKEKGEGFASAYRKMLKEHELHFQENMVRLGRQPGDVSIQKLDPNKVFNTVDSHLDYFLASWNPSLPAKNERVEPIGYFFFIDGKFRWDSTINFVTLQTERPDGAGVPNPANGADGSAGNATVISVATPGRGGVGYPSCSYCPPAEFPKDKRHLDSDVVVALKAVIQTNGRAAQIQIVRSGGSDFDEKAMEAVRHWRFKPAQGPDGVPVAVTTSIEVTFHR